MHPAAEPEISHDFELPVAVTLAAPAVRTVVVEAGVDSCAGADAEPWHHIYPVPAIRTAVVHRYTKRAPRRAFPRKAPTHSELVDLGWRFTDVELVNDVMIVESIDGGLGRRNGLARPPQQARPF